MWQIIRVQIRVQSPTNHVSNVGNREQNHWLPPYRVETSNSQTVCHFLIDGPAIRVLVKLIRQVHLSALRYPTRCRRGGLINTCHKDCQSSRITFKCAKTPHLYDVQKVISSAAQIQYITLLLTHTSSWARATSSSYIQRKNNTFILQVNLISIYLVSTLERCFF